METIAALNQYLRDLNLPAYRSEKCRISKLAELLEVEKRLLSVLDKQETYGNIIRDAYPELMKNQAERTVVKDSDLQKESLKEQVRSALQPSPLSVIVDNNPHLSCFFCPECKPEL